MRSFWSSRCRGEGGAVVAEFALASPFLVLLALGIIEYGTVYRNETALTGALRNAARAAAQGKDDPRGDKTALESFNASIGSTDNLTVVRVVIYESTTSNGAPPANCKTASTSNGGAGINGSCNVYNANQVANAQTGNWPSTTATSCSTGNWDRFWCFNTRYANLAGTNSPPDFLGVYAELTYDSVTGLVPGGSMTISDYTVNRIEPNI